MAGSGYRTFVANEVHASSNVQGYLMDQAVMVFADDTARDAALTPSEGMHVYLSDTNTREYYDGGAWVQLSAQSVDDARMFYPTGGSDNYWTYDDTLNVSGLYHDGGQVAKVHSGGLDISGTVLRTNGIASDDYFQNTGSVASVVIGGVEDWRVTPSAAIGTTANRIRFGSVVSDATYFQMTSDSDAFWITNSVTAMRLLETVTDQSWRLEVNGPGTASSPTYAWTGGGSSGLYRNTNFVGISVAGTPAMGATNGGALAMGDNTVATAGTDVHYDTVTLSGSTMYALRQTASLRELKDGFEPWALSDDDYLRIEPTSYLSKYHYIDPATGDRMAWGRDSEGNATSVPPDGQLVRQAGFVWENLADIDLHLVSHRGVDRNAMIATNTAQIQKLTRRVAELEETAT